MLSKDMRLHPFADNAFTAQNLEWQWVWRQVYHVQEFSNNDAFDTRYMSAFKKLKDNAIDEPKTRLELLLILCALIIGYFYIYVYQHILHIEVKLVDLQTLIQIPIISIIVIPLIRYLLVRPDPLQRSPSKRRAIRFFQNEFPSKYILERCRRCVEDDRSCPNYIREASRAHVRYWFYDILHGAIEAEDPRRVRDTFEKGYTCKLLYSLTWILGFASATAIITILYHLVSLFVKEGWTVSITPLQILFPTVCALLIALITIMNSSNENTPSGCWHAWREINRMHISWLRSHDDLLVNTICHDGTGTKTFKEKPWCDPT